MNENRIKSWVLWGGLLITAALLFWGCGGEIASNVPDNVLLVIMDTVRADHLGCYGYAWAETPNLDGLAREGALFANAVSQVPETGPSVSSILSSLYPHNHGVRVNTKPLPRKVVTLAEILKKNGFQTAAFTDTFPLYNLNILQGFDHFQKRIFDRSLEEAAIESVIRGPLDWMEKQKDKRIFILMHFYDAHMPYRPVVPSQRTKALNYKDEFTGSYGPVMLLWKNEYTINDADVANMVSLYDDEIRFIDICLGRICRELRQLGLWDRTLVAITADHGESLGDHDYYFDHGDYLYEDQIHVPLIFRYPRMPERGMVIEAQARTIDIMPTILHILKIKYGGKIDGVSLLPLIWGKKQILGTRYAFSESDLIDFGKWNNRGFISGVEGKHVAVRHNRMKLIYVPGKLDGEFELYNLEEDPGETNNVIEREPEVAAKLKKALSAWLVGQGRQEFKEEKLDKKTRDILESLHYIRKK